MTQLPLNIDLLTKEERLDLIEELWDSLNPEADIPLSAAQQTEIRARSQALRDGKLKTIALSQEKRAIACRHE